MEKLKKDLENLLDEVIASYNALKIDEKIKELASIDEKLADGGIWANPTYAQDITKRAKFLRKDTDEWSALRVQVSDLIELLSLCDESMKDELSAQYEALEKTYLKLKKDLLYQGEFDDKSVILRLSAGVGGTDAQDFTEMLERMYIRYAEKNGLEVDVVDRSSGEQAGIKSSILEISGNYVYGKLKGEHGVHRLVRLSPFNADNLRQTSFALVEVLPKIDDAKEVEINPEDLKIDVYRSSGKGGQSVNTTDSAVRITHLPTKIVVAIQNERSQLQNKEMALKILRSKLRQLQLEQKAKTIAELKAGKSADWGQQIRNYVLHPYSLVKDTRTKYEESNPQSVFDGNLDGFIDAYLEWLALSV